MEGASDLRLNDELRDFLQLEEILKQISQCDPHCNELQNLERIKIHNATGSHPKLMMDGYSKGAKSKKSIIHDSAPKVRGFPSSDLVNKQGLSTPVAVRQSRSNFTVPQPFNLSTGRRASLTYTSGDARYRQQPQSPQISRNFNPTLSMSMSDASKHQALKRFPFRADTRQDNYDNVSVSSIQSSQTPRAKASKFTTVKEFKFHSDARAEQRKEFYSKLQEKASSKEKEKTQMQAKSKIKALRNSLTFKASPSPSFYHGGMKAEKPELPKIQTSRARSPNISRRQSVSGVSNTPRSPIVSQYEMKETKNKHLCNASGGQDCRSLLKHNPSSARSISNMQGSASSTLADSRVEVRGSTATTTITPLIVSSELVMGNEEAHTAHVTISFPDCHEAKDRKMNVQ